MKRYISAYRMKARSIQRAGIRDGATRRGSRLGASSVCCVRCCGWVTGVRCCCVLRCCHRCWAASSSAPVRWDGYSSAAHWDGCCSATRSYGWCWPAARRSYALVS